MPEAALVLPDSKAAVADAIVAHRGEHLRVGAERLQLAADWADLHPVDDEGEPMARMPGRPVGRPAGADGTPEVSEFAARELGVLLGIHPLAAQGLMADAVNLRHRHPRLWAAVQAGEAVDWVAAKTSRMVAAAELGVNEARWVDAATHRYASTLPPSRYFALVEAKIIEADTVAAERRREAHEHGQFVRAGQSTEHGLKTVVARAQAADVIFFLAMVQRIAEILAERGDTDSLDVRRARAIGILATPLRAARMLAEAAGQEVAEVDPEKLLPRSTLYVHVSEESLHTGAGVARVEGVGPVTLAQAQDFVRHCNVSVRPVLDLAGMTPVDGYEVPTRMGEAVRLQMPFESFPYATRSSRGADLDHTRRYQPPSRGGPPGQTRPGNLGPLTRPHHRLKTHEPGWQVLQPSAGVYLWRTPSGYWLRVDYRGTRPLGTRMSLMEEHTRTLIDRHS